MAHKPALQLESRDHGVRILWIDDPEESQNTLKTSLVEEFDQALQSLGDDPAARVLVFVSAKASGFLAGANLQMLQGVTSAEDGAALSRLAQSINARIEALPCTTVAAIHGPCLGGGLELALAFDARIAADSRATRIGVPEVQLGLLPAGGGTQRLTRLIDIQRAMDLLLTGRQLDARRALRYGLVDEVVPEAILLDAAINLGTERAHRVTRRRGRRWLEPARWRHWALTRTAPGRRLLVKQSRAQVLKKTRGNYPAPERIISVVKTGLSDGLAAGLDAEAQAFGELLLSPQAAELINLFFATTELKKEQPAGDDVAPRAIAKIGVLGGGLMGAGISYVSTVQAGVQVRVKERDESGVAGALRYVDERLRKRVAQKRSTPLQRRQQLARVSGTTDYSGFHDAPLVIEAVFEDLELKRSMLGEVERAGPEGVIFASNTSALPITRIAAAAQRPENVIGMHYFSPVEKMPLLEIVMSPQTSPQVVADCVEFGRRQGKTVIVVNDGPGFYTTRILVPFMIEAANLISEGATVEDIDTALADFGFPVGPITLLDEVGIDVAAKVVATAQAAFGERVSAPDSLRRLLDDNRLGRKNARGFFHYDRASGTKGAVDDSVYAVVGAHDAHGDGPAAAEICERCVLAMVNEAVHCLDEGVLRNRRDGDIGAVFGLGFPPFRGGPFRYLETLGTEQVLQRLQELSERLGPRFAPSPLLARLDGGTREP